MKIFLISIALSFHVNGLYAQNNPTSLHTDNRIKEVFYKDNEVVPLKGSTFTSTQIQFDHKEEVLDIEGGDTSAWMVTYHPSLSNAIFIKPTIFGSDTNMTVITNQHTYYFHLVSNKNLSKDKHKTYALKFAYSTPKADKITIKNASHIRKVVNTAYTFNGNPELVPKHVFDDGKFTYFELNASSAVPAIFAVDAYSGEESLVNIRKEGNYLIVQRLAPQFTLRQGKLATSVFNTKEITRMAANRRPQ